MTKHRKRKPAKKAVKNAGSGGGQIRLPPRSPSVDKNGRKHAADGRFE